MFITIEIDRNWTLGLDWLKYTKGIRLGFIAIHITFKTFEDFMGHLCESYHQERIKRE